VTVASQGSYYPDVDYRGIWIYFCGSDWYYDQLDDAGYLSYHYIYQNASAFNITANFTASLTQGSGPLYITFTDTSNGTPSSWNWSVSPLSGWSVNPYDLDNEDITIQFISNGNYTISHGASNAYSSDIETKTDYIWIFNSSATVTTPFTAIDLAFVNPISGASIGLYDIGNSSWTNGTTGADGKVSITTLQDHLINGYAVAAGYDDSDLMGVDATTYGHTFYMYPAGYTNVTEGNVTVFINVVDDTNFGAKLPGVQVTGMVGASSKTATTDGGGIARFVFANNTDVHFGASKPGYAGTTITLNTGIPSGGSAAVTGTIHMFRGAVTTAPTVTTLPGGGTPTPIETYLPYCDPSSADYDQAKCRTSHGEFSLSWLSENMFSLIQVCVLVTIIYLLGGISRAAR
jgi:PKD repeat protein